MRTHWGLQAHTAVNEQHLKHGVECGQHSSISNQATGNAWHGPGYSLPTWDLAQEGEGVEAVAVRPAGHSAHALAEVSGAAVFRGKLVVGLRLREGLVYAPALVGGVRGRCSNGAAPLRHIPGGASLSHSLVSLVASKGKQVHNAKTRAHSAHEQCGRVRLLPSTQVNDCLTESSELRNPIQ